MKRTEQATRRLEDTGPRHCDDRSGVQVANDGAHSEAPGLPAASERSNAEPTQSFVTAGGAFRDDLAGRVVGGRFEVRGPLASDGFGLLLEAVDRKADQAVSLRVVRSGSVASRLGLQLSAVANLTHPGLLAVLGVLRSGASRSATSDAAGGSTLIVQGALKGQSVAGQVEARRRLGGKPIGLSEACHVITQVVGVLTKVRASGPHGAVGPETVWTDTEGHVQLTDLVLSRVLLASDGDGGDGAEARRTLFVAPEIKSGKPPQVASDVYGVSALLYSLLTGRSPAIELMAASTLHAEVTEALDTVLMRGLSPDPRARQASPEAFHAALLAALRSGQREASRSHKRESARMPIPKPAASPVLFAPPPEVRASLATATPSEPVRIDSGIRAVGKPAVNTQLPATLRSETAPTLAPDRAPAPYGGKPPALPVGTSPAVKVELPAAAPSAEIPPPSASSAEVPRSAPPSAEVPVPAKGEVALALRVEAPPALHVEPLRTLEGPERSEAEMVSEGIEVSFPSELAAAPDPLAPFPGSAQEWLRDEIATWWRRKNKLAMLQSALYLLSLASLMVLIWAQGTADSGRVLTRAEAELSATRKNFNRQEAEHAMLSQADALGTVSLAFEYTFRDKTGLPKKSSQTLSVRPLAAVTLDTLGQLAAHAQPDSALTVHVLDAKAFASSLSWRLVRTGRSGAPTLAAVELFWADLDPQAVDRELQVAALHSQSIAAHKTLRDSKRKLSYLVAGPRRLNSSKAQIPRATTFNRQARSRPRPGARQAGALFAERKKASAEAQARYEEAAKSAESLREIATASGSANVAAARVTVHYGTEQISFDLPVAVRAERVPVTPLAGVSLDATRSTGLWDTLRDQTPEAAHALVTTHIPWHARPIAMLGVEAHGMRLLQLLPCALLALLGLVSLRMLRPGTRRDGSATLMSAADSARLTLQDLSSATAILFDAAASFTRHKVSVVRAWWQKLAPRRTAAMDLARLRLEHCLVVTRSLVRRLRP